MNMGDLLFQLIFFIFLIGLFAAVFYAVRSLVGKGPDKQERIEQKLDRIIELLEKNHKG
ncbi:DUF4083 family protein [Bacillus sp. ISL-35]|uniref:DUF4083 family protein n=1 Tax=Bacillus sp. ISL-35 TaxID=2819122 RepID=UPI001BE6ED28|nr:DUF4083 family protein [Bacillus sp. ISL-35]MBT2680416.1 DUF4083 family protein [Bacillus sp. ISL-35]MBT2704292.1 DUF4083 family protein [Chryseobacterium sp. ISL-80]